jgi:hypothetical protein
MYYYGLKLHTLGFRRISQLPFPGQFLLTPASENDLNLFRQAWRGIENRVFYGDKIYHDGDYFENAFKNQNSIMLTPVKGIKRQSENIRLWDKAANDLFPTAVSRVRQPTESLFN